MSIDRALMEIPKSDPRLSILLAWFPFPGIALFDALSAMFSVGYDPVRDDRMPVADLPLFWCYNGLHILIGCTVSAIAIYRSWSRSDLGSDSLIEQEVKLGWLGQFVVWLAFLLIR